MQNLFSDLNKDILSIIRLAGKEAEKNSFTAYLVGGFIRDLFLRRKNFDIDIVAESDGILFARQLARRFQGTLKTYPQFKTGGIFFREYFVFPSSLRL